MKTTLSYIIPIAGFILAMPVLQGQTRVGTAPKQEIKKEIRVIATTDDAPGAEPKIERRMKFIHEGVGHREMETVTFLGVQSAPVDGTLAEQLGLQKDTGLVVVEVVPDSPAASVLKSHDVLLKLNDQVLIHQVQLSVLVRNQKEGDEVTLTFIRAGKQTSAKVKLGKHEVPKMAMFNLRIPGAESPSMRWVTEGTRMTGRDDVDHLLGLMALGENGAPHIVRHNQEAGDRRITVTVDTGDSSMNFSDEKVSLELKIKDGRKELLAKNAKGETMFSGPINTPEERKGIPSEIAERLGKIETMHGFSFKTGEEFEGGETKVVRPLGHGISLPLPAPAVHPQQVL